MDSIHYIFSKQKNTIISCSFEIAGHQIRTIGHPTGNGLAARERYQLRTHCDTHIDPCVEIDMVK